MSPPFADVTNARGLTSVSTVVSHTGALSYARQRGDNLIAAWLDGRFATEHAPARGDVPTSPDFARQTILDGIGTETVPATQVEPTDAPNPAAFTLAFEGHSLRMTKDDNGDVWFVLADVCRVLELSAPHMVAGRLEEADRSTTSIRSNGQNRAVTVVNESGLYDVVLDSRKPQAKKFRRWITTEVVPSIRKTGGYAQPGYTAPAAPAAPVLDPAVIGSAVAESVAAALAPLLARAERLEHGADVASGHDGGMTDNHDDGRIDDTVARMTDDPKIADYAREVVKNAPPLSPETLDKVVTIIRSSQARN